MKIMSIKIKKNSKLKEKILKYKNQILITIFLLFFSFCFVLNSSKYIGVVLEGILLYAVKVLPSLFPFFFITKILGSFDFIISCTNRFKRLSKFLFNTPAISCYIFFMSVISGYPMGAKLTSDFYEYGLINKVEAQRIMSFCSTSGPLFVIGSVGIGFFTNQTFGVFLFLSHILASILNGLIYRNCGEKLMKNKDLNIEKDAATIKTNTFSLEDTMYSTIRSVLIVGGYIVIFYTFIEILLDLNLLSPLISVLQNLGLNPFEAKGLVSGIIEVTKGISILSGSQNIQTTFIISSGLISFGGFSIFFQSFAFLDKIKLSKKFFLLQKITHSILSVAISYLISLFIL